MTAITDLALTLFGGFSLLGVVSLILALGGGWVGGKLASQVKRELAPVPTASGD